jgi:hypothetical protein
MALLSTFSCLSYIVPLFPVILFHFKTYYFLRFYLCPIFEQRVTPPILSIRIIVL